MKRGVFYYDLVCSVPLGKMENSHFGSKNGLFGGFGVEIWAF
jgi:hypothetical protein